ncbi:MAG: hypothetical protein WAM44_03410, partial [Chthoniobacterales bacterium]
MNRTFFVTSLEYREGDGKAKACGRRNGEWAKGRVERWGDAEMRRKGEWAKGRKGEWAILAKIG